MLVLQFQNFEGKRKSSQVGYLRWSEFSLVVALMTKRSSKWLFQDWEVVHFNGSRITRLREGRKEKRRWEPGRRWKVSWWVPFAHPLACSTMLSYFFPHSGTNLLTMGVLCPFLSLQFPLLLGHKQSKLHKRVLPHKTDLTSVILAEEDALSAKDLEPFPYSQWTIACCSRWVRRTPSKPSISHPTL